MSSLPGYCMHGLAMVFEKFVATAWFGVLRVPGKIESYTAKLLPPIFSLNIGGSSAKL